MHTHKRLTFEVVFAHVRGYSYDEKQHGERGNTASLLKIV